MKYIYKYKKQAIDILKFGIKHNQKIINELNNNSDIYDIYIIDLVGGIWNKNNKLVDFDILVNEYNINDEEIKSLIKELQKFEDDGKFALYAKK